MAYIPPHKRQPDSSGRPSPVPDSLGLRFKKDFNLTSSRPNRKANNMMHVSGVSHNWSVVGKSDDEFPPYVHLLPVSLEVIERQTREKPLILVKDQRKMEDNEVQGNVLVNPWVSIAENVHKHLRPAFDDVRKQMESQDWHDMKSKLVARFGKLLFNGTCKISVDAARKSPALESTLSRMKRTFYTGLPASFTESLSKDVPNIGISFVKQKDTYYIKLSDSTQPDVTIFCKCTVGGDKMLQLYKVEQNPNRHMIVDMTCIDKDLDLRIMLFTTKTLTASLIDDEMENIRYLINSAVIDSNARGGLRWPLGKSHSGERYKIIGTWHTISTSYKSSSLRLKVRHADRFDFISSFGESTWEAELFMKRLVSDLQEKVDDNLIYDMLESTMKLIWEHFLSCEEPVLT